MIRNHPPVVHRAKTFLQLGLGLSEPEAHATLQRFSASCHSKLADVAEVVCFMAARGELNGPLRGRFKRAVERATNRR
ncbi:MAG: ANTAR domain-containing protein [Patescibacteria group bacterium]|nr:ANTAR domain-containing protein [Patescibacteria group bacterium]